LSKDEQKKIITEKALKKEFIYVEEMVKHDKLREELKQSLDNKLLVYIDPGKRSPLYMLGSNGKYLNYTNRSRIKATKRLKINKLIENKKQKTTIYKKTVKTIEGYLSEHNSKSCNIRVFEKYVTKKLAINKTLSGFYLDTYFRKLRWFGYLNVKNHENKLIEKIKDTYSKKNDLNEITDLPRIIIGDWNENNGMKLKYMSTPGIGLKRRLLKDFKVHTLDEYLTSKLHYKNEVECENLCIKYNTIKESTKEKKEGTQKIHSVLIYKIERNQSGCINRDRNSVLNMQKIVKSLINTQERPEKYKRTLLPCKNGRKIKKLIDDQKVARVSANRKAKTPKVTAKKKLERKQKSTPKNIAKLTLSLISSKINPKTNPKVNPKDSPINEPIRNNALN
jgi:hypothetical protein